jgi:penicillin amidase
VIDAPLRDRKLIVPNSQVVLASLRNILDNFAQRKGMGVSGLAFFRTSAMANATEEAQRDFILLQSLRQALDALAGPDFTLAFNGSTNQRDYRWGMLHRAFFPHSFGMTSDFAIPSPSSNFPSPLPGLFGLPRDGGFEVPNASGHPVRAQRVNDFIFSSGPSERFTAVMKPGAITAVNAVPGGQSGSRKSQFYTNLLGLWLTADVHPLVLQKQQLQQQASSIQVFQPIKE